MPSENYMLTKICTYLRCSRTISIYFSFNLAKQSVFIELMQSKTKGHSKLTGEAGTSPHTFITIGTFMYRLREFQQVILVIEIGSLFCNLK